MDTLGIEATPEEVDLMIDEIDQDNNGEIDFEGEVKNLDRTSSSNADTAQLPLLIWKSLYIAVNTVVLSEENLVGL